MKVWCLLINLTTLAIATSLFASTTDATPFVQGHKIILGDLPICYVYDHCPFCVRVRLTLGIKNVKYNCVFLSNDDIPTPTKLIGKMIAPIFFIPEDDLTMAESLDIIDKVDSFIKNHQLPPYEKPEWKGDGTDANPGIAMDEKLRLYAEAMSKYPTPFVEDLNAKLIELNDMVFSEHYCSEGGIVLGLLLFYYYCKGSSVVREVKVING